MLNLLSLLLGLSAWGLGLAALVRKESRGLSLCSCTCCALALLGQLLEIRRRVAAADWAALMDTLPALITAASVLLLVTIILNTLALITGKRYEHVSD